VGCQGNANTLPKPEVAIRGEGNLVSEGWEAGERSHWNVKARQEGKAGTCQVVWEKKREKSCLFLRKKAKRDGPPG